MKKIFKTILLIFVTLLGSALVISIMLSTLRGVAGNPEPEYIVEHLRSKGMPFELSPERARYALTYSVAENNSFEFTREIASMALPDLGSVNGKYVSLFAPGVSIIALPFYTLGKSVGLAQVFTFAVSTLFALLSVLCISLAVRKLTNNVFAGLAAGLTFLFATNAWAYAGVLYQHHLTTFLILFTCYLLLFPRLFLRTILIGIIFGISIFVEYPSGIFFIPLLLLLLWKHIDLSEQKEKFRMVFHFSIVTFTIGMVIGLAPLIWYNIQAYDNPWQLAGTLKGIRSFSDATESAALKPQISYKTKSALGFFKLERMPQSADVLLTSIDRGLVFFSPVILIGLLGLIPLLKKNSAFGYALMGTLGVFMILYSMWGDPWGGWAFGPRYMIPVVGLLSISLGMALNTYRKNVWFSIIFLILLIYSITINTVGALTTLQIPPSVEQDAALLPKLTYLHNFDLLFRGISNSFIFNTYLKFYIPLHEFAGIIVICVSWLITLMYLLISKKTSPKSL